MCDLGAQNSALFQEFNCPENQESSWRTGIVLEGQFAVKESHSQLCQMVSLAASNTALYLFETRDSELPSHYCQLSFNCLFELSKGPQTHNTIVQGKITSYHSSFSIKLQKKDCKSMSFHGEGIRNQTEWQHFLGRRVSQHNFHEHFVPVRKLMQGTFASVYLVRRISDNKLFAAKAFSKELTYAKAFGKEALMNEIDILRRLSHEGVLEAEAVFESINSVYVVCEYLQGRQLLDKMQSHNFSNSETRSMMRSILLSLDYLSGLGIIHRDLKPENIMLRDANSLEAVIIDFGLATFGGADQLFGRCGTPGFIAPEILKEKSKQCSCKSDVFSAGVIFHFLLFGKSVFNAKTYNELLEQNKLCEFGFEGEEYQQISKQSLELLKSMLEVDPTKRTSAADALKHPYFSEEVIEEKMDLLNAKISEASALSTMSSPNSQETSQNDFSKKRVRQHDINEQEAKYSASHKKVKKDLLSPTSIKVSRFTLYEQKFIDQLVFIN